MQQVLLSTVYSIYTVNYWAVELTTLSRLKYVLFSIKLVYIISYIYNSNEVKTVYRYSEASGLAEAF